MCSWYPQWVRVRASQLRADALSYLRWRSAMTPQCNRTLIPSPAGYSLESEVLNDARGSLNCFYVQASFGKFPLHVTITINLSLQLVYLVQVIWTWAYSRRSSGKSAANGLTCAASSFRSLTGSSTAGKDDDASLQCVNIIIIKTCDNVHQTYSLGSRKSKRVVTNTLETVSFTPSRWKCA